MKVKSTNRIEIYKWLKERAMKSANGGMWLNDFHWNDDFLDFADKFYPKMITKNVCRKFNEHMKELVAGGLVTKSSASTRGLIGEFGRRKINNYIPTEKLKQLAKDINNESSIDK